MTHSALELARIAGRAEDARIKLHHRVLGNTRKRNALAKAILAASTPSERDLYEFHFGADYNDARGWDLLLDLSGAK